MVCGTTSLEELSSIVLKRLVRAKLRRFGLVLQLHDHLVDLIDLSQLTLQISLSLLPLLLEEIVTTGTRQMHFYQLNTLLVTVN